MSLQLGIKSYNGYVDKSSVTRAEGKDNFVLSSFHVVSTVLWMPSSRLGVKEVDTPCVMIVVKNMGVPGVDRTVPPFLLAEKSVGTAHSP